MTKRKAIEAGIDRWEGTGFWRVEEDARPLAEYTYDEGFAAGVLHAAKRFMALDGGWRPCVGEIQREVRALAKKARAQ